MRKFLGRPTLGGWLTIVNCLLWAAMTLLPDTAVRHAELLLALVALVLSLPVACVALFPVNTGMPTLSGAILTSVAIGINSLCWGYGIAWLLGFPRRIRESRQHRRWQAGLCGICAYDLRASKNRCPECGTPIPTRSV